MSVVSSSNPIHNVHNVERTHNFWRFAKVNLALFEIFYSVHFISSPIHWLNKDMLKKEKLRSNEGKYKSLHMNHILT